MNQKIFNPKENRRLLALSTIFAVALALLTIPRTASAYDNHSTEYFTENLDIVIPASDGCSGEDVHVYGPLAGMIQTTTDAQGGTHIELHYTPYVNAVGLTSGLKYQAKGPGQYHTNLTQSSAYVFSGVNVTQLVAPGSTANLFLLETIHVTINADGTKTVNFDNARFACRG
ncbi:MAG TPA: hypothetical protein VKB86_18630 [Pyrinomonadaceae bacterium]|nr:hypothetical protein [Pyrinomonadaceae bacterium]